MDWKPQILETYKSLADKNADLLILAISDA